MGIDTEGFLHSENAKKFEYLALIDYLRDNYSLTAVDPGNGYMTIYFKDGEDKRQLMVHHRYTSYVNEPYPEFENTAGSAIPRFSKPYIVRFDVSCWGNSDKIIRGIVEHFGGGYFIHNDCESEWEVVSGDNK